MRKVETTSAGRFKVRFRYKGKQTSETFDRKREAERFAQLLDALGAQGALDSLYEDEQAATVPTLDAVAAAHIEHLTGIEPGTRVTYTRMWERIWSPRLGALPANRLTRDDVARAINDLGETYSRKSLENHRGLLAGVVQRAVEEGHLSKNHARGIRLPRGKEGDRVQMQLLTQDELDDVISRVPEHYQPLVRFLAGTGCRWGEAVALQVGDVRLPYVNIRRALKWSPDNNRAVGPTKTEKSARTIQLPSQVLADMPALLEDKARSDLVFTAPRGGAVLHRTFWSRVWQPAVEHLDPRPRIHDLRHGHASTLLAAGVPIHIVQARLGHSTIQVTVDTYSHLLPDAQMMAAQAAEMAFVRRPSPAGELEQAASLAPPVEVEALSEHHAEE